MIFELSKEQARRFLLKKQGLFGTYRFKGEEGILQYIRQAGCIQYDPIDVCGKNAELALQSRVEGFQKEMLTKLLYEDRTLIDYFDKNLAIIPAENWCYYERMRVSYCQDSRAKTEVDQVADQVLDQVRERGFLCSKDLYMDQKVDWPWNATTLSRAALETLYFRGHLVVHHKKGAAKYYSRTQDCLPADIWKRADPYPDDAHHLDFKIRQRIGAVGLLWDGPSDAWLGIVGMKAGNRAASFERLIREERIIPVIVQGVKRTLYALSEDRDMLTSCAAAPRQMEDGQRTEGLQKTSGGKIVKGQGQKRMEFLAPLDCFMWDRKLIKELFDFSYKWEIYTPAPQRKYGYYVLPLLYGEQFAGRIEMACDRRAGELVVKNLFAEGGFRETAAYFKDLESCLKRFAEFNGQSVIRWEHGKPKGLR